jgi:Cd2+/Zn2+-exporting ATPase/Cu+-exporting ATPase
VLSSPGLRSRPRPALRQIVVVGVVAGGIGVGLAAFGFLNPLLAAFIHVTSELAFILNSARLLPAVAAKTNVE